MNSYVKFIFRYTSCARRLWSQQTGQNKSSMEDYIKSISRADQLRFVLDQTLALSYLFWFYGPDVHELAVSYAEWLKAFTKHIASHNEYTEALAGIMQQVKIIQDTFYGAQWVDVNISDINTFLYGLDTEKKDETYPHSLSQNAAIPYLMHRNSKVVADCDIFNGVVTLPKFIFEPACCLYGYENTSVGCITICEYRIGSNFTAKLSSRYDLKDMVVAKNLKTIKDSGYDLLMFYLKTDVNAKQFEGIVRDFCAFKIHEDLTRSVTPNFKLCYATSVILNGMFSTDFLDIANKYGALPREKLSDTFFGLANVLFCFLSILNKYQGVVVADKSFFVSFFGSFDKNKSSDLSKIVRFVENNGENVASVEGLQAWRNSPLGSCEAIELISQSKSVIAGKEETGNTEDTSVPEESEETKLDLSDIPDIDDADPALEAEAVAEEDEDTSGDTDEGSDTTSSEEGTEDGDNAPEETGDNNNEGSDAPGGESGSSTATDTQASGEPEKIDASDDDGIVFEMIPEGSETVDSVVFREELDQFITDTLKNPPKNTSPQTIIALTKLQSNWLHLLTVRTILSILGKLVSVPEKFITTLNQMESIPNE